MKFVCKLPVQFRDIDSLGHVNSTTYLQYMESARVEFTRCLGLIESGFSPPFIVVACRCEYQKPIVDERGITVHLWTSRIGNRSWDFDYSVQAIDGTSFAIGRTTQVAFSYNLMSTVRITNELRKGLEEYSAQPLRFRDTNREN